jgi:transcription elongation factor GreA
MAADRVVQLTSEGVVRLEAELAELRERRQALFDAVQGANSNNEASDSGEYEELRDDLVYAESRVREMEQILERAEVIERGSKDGIAGIGSHLTLKIDGETEEWFLVSSEEASIYDGDVSVDSPVGRALVGKRSGESITVTTPGGEVQYEVIAVK